jgi:hypothetical protein
MHRRLASARFLAGSGERGSLACCPACKKLKPAGACPGPQRPRRPPHLAGRLPGADALPQRLGRLVQLAADEDLPHHQVGAYRQEAQQRQQVDQLDGRLQALAQLEEGLRGGDGRETAGRLQVRMYSGGAAAGVLEGRR